MEVWAYDSFVGNACYQGNIKVPYLIGLNIPTHKGVPICSLGSDGQQYIYRPPGGSLLTERRPLEDYFQRASTSEERMRSL